MTVFAGSREFMRTLLHDVQPRVKPVIARWVNDPPPGMRIRLRMEATTRIHTQGISKRRHYVQEWMELRGYKPTKGWCRGGSIGVLCLGTTISPRSQASLELTSQWLSSAIPTTIGWRGSYGIAPERKSRAFETCWKGPSRKKLHDLQVGA